MDYYHVLNRGFEKRRIVDDDSDRLRFVHSLYVFNDRNYVDSNHRIRNFHKPASERDILVYIHAWCLMDNHYHLLLSPVDDDLKNLSMFMKKLNMGYAKYYNERHDRSGYLWQGRYKKVVIENNAHFIYIPYYIHLNPLDKKYPEWRSGTISKNRVRSALSDLHSYRWSSFQDYSNQKNFPSLLYNKVLSKIVPSQSKELEKTISQLVCDESRSPMPSLSKTLE